MTVTLCACAVARQCVRGRLLPLQVLCVPRLKRAAQPWMYTRVRFESCWRLGPRALAGPLCFGVPNPWSQLLQHPSLNVSLSVPVLPVIPLLFVLRT